MAIVACSTTPVQTGIVNFVSTEFTAAYPEFAGLSSTQQTNAFALATLYLNNTCRGIVFNAALRQVLLYLLTAHILFLNSGTNDGAGNIVAAPGVVGRINTATEGTVSVGAEMVATANSAFYLQTKYGAMFWEATARFRTMMYIAPMICGDSPWGDDSFYQDNTGNCNSGC